MIVNNVTAKQRRQSRIRQKIRGTSTMPRLSVFRSNKFIYAQIINDAEHKTVAGVSETAAAKMKGTKIERAKAIGLALAKEALTKKVTKVVFDKGSYAYHGRVKALAEGAREGGLQF